MTHPSDATIGRERALEALDLAQRTTPFCDRCGRPMLPVSKGTSGLWLECSSLQRERPRLRRMLDAGVSEEGVVDALYVGFLFNTIDRIADSLGFLPVSEEQYGKGADRLLQHGYL